MKYQDLIYHLEDNACTIDHLVDDAYMATNCISFDECIIEKLSVYGSPTLCHYFYELKVPAPDFMKEDYDSYVEFRKNVLTDYVAK